MVFDGLLGLPHVDWAGVESAAPHTVAPKHGKKSKQTPRKHRAARHR
jgi:beta-lactamase class C